MPRLTTALLVAAAPLLGAFAVPAFGQGAPADHLLISEVGFDAPSDESSSSQTSEFIEVFNPTNQTIALENVYLTDVPSVYTEVTDSLNSGSSGQRLSVGSADFIVRFPQGATLLPGQVAVVTMNSDVFLPDFFTPAGTGQSAPLTDMLKEFAKTGALLFEVTQDGASDGVADMVIAHSLLTAGGTTAPQMNLSNSKELVVAFRWDQTTGTKVDDLDTVSWGSLTDNIVDKSAIDLTTGARIPKTAPDGTAYAFDDGVTLKPASAAPDIPGSNTTANGNRNSIHRDGATETGELAAGGNGITGNDETTEDWLTTFTVRDMDPGAAPLFGQALLQAQATLDLGSVSAGVTVTGTVPLTNTGAVSMAILAIDVTGATTGTFVVSGVQLPLAKPLVIGAGQTFDLDFALTPTLGSGQTSANERVSLAATYQISIKDPSDPARNTVSVVQESFDVTATVALPPELSVAVGPGGSLNAAFSTVGVGRRSELVVTLTNGGVADLRVSGFAVSGSAAFSIDDDTSAIVTPQQPVTRTITFEPRAGGSFTGQLEITSNDPQNPTVTIDLNGRALSARPRSSGGGGGAGCYAEPGSGQSSMFVLLMGLLAGIVAVRRRKS